MFGHRNKVQTELSSVLVELYTWYDCLHTWIHQRRPRKALLGSCKSARPCRIDIACIIGCNIAGLVMGSTGRGKHMQHVSMCTYLMALNILRSPKILGE